MPGFTLAAVPLAFALGAIATRVLVAMPPARLAVDFAQPLVVVTAWGAYGLGPFAVLAVVITIATGALALSLAPNLRNGPSLAATLVLATLALAAALAWPVVFSSDTYAYAAYGDAVVHGHDPYLPVPRAYHDAFVDAARWQWGGGSFPACVYGPAFVALATAATLLAGDRLGATLWALRIAAALAFLIGVVLLNDALAGKRHRRAAVAAYALNPVVLWSVAEGHNDIFVLLAAFGAWAALRRGAAGVAGLVLGLTPILKLVGLVAAPATWLWLRTRRADATTFARAGAAGLAIAAALILPLQLKTLGAFGAAHYTPQFSFQSVVGLVPAMLVVVAAALTGLRALWRGERDGMIWLAIAGWLALGNPYPWYALWIVPAAVFLPPSRATVALWMTTIFAALRYLPEAFGNMPHLSASILTLIGLAPLVFAVPLRAEEVVNPASPEKAPHVR